ncbi:MAG TPA: 4-hydroxy-3-methylbut-2-enyl diphosphate reductase [Desulfobulbus sp.]|nr:4-hydroxy-3-methylbut-2-enyl diphosphate reductase [Desulfobulbus sp.]
MEIILAKPRGFCAGVNRAIAIVNRALERYGSPVYVLHEIVHNTYVVNNLARKGAVFVKSLDDIPGGSVTIFSAHGVARSVEEQARVLGLHVIDATCPLVTRVHRRVARLNKIGYDVLIIGHRHHPEVEGTCGRALGRVHVISSAADIADLRVTDPTRVGYVTQTTLSMDDAADLIARLKERFPQIDIPDRTDICYATQNRQTAVRELAARVDLFLVVGSRNSSNSNRLREVAEKQGVRAYLIDNRDEIDPAWLEGVSRVGLTAGASAPEVLVEEVIDWLRQREPSTVREMDGPEENTRFKLPELPDFALQET